MFVIVEVFNLLNGIVQYYILHRVYYRQHTMFLLIRDIFFITLFPLSVPFLYFLLILSLLNDEDFYWGKKNVQLHFV